jgi:FixJ family two-component response regulator
MTAGKTVVAIVDDDPRILESLEDLLESAGYSVRQFSSPVALLEYQHLPQIDVLVSDVGLPSFDGFELRRRLKAVRPELPVILIAGRHEKDEHPQIGQAYQGFFRKPFDAKALLTAISQALRASHGEA